MLIYYSVPSTVTPLPMHSLDSNTPASLIATSCGGHIVLVSERMAPDDLVAIWCDHRPDAMDDDASEKLYQTTLDESKLGGPAVSR